MDTALNKSTLRMYFSAWNIFKRFSLMQGVLDILQSPDRAREQCIISFVIFCKEQLNLNYASIKSYLCAIKYFYCREWWQLNITFRTVQHMSQASIMEFLMLCRVFIWNGSASWHPQQPYFPRPYLSKFCSLEAIRTRTPTNV
jgi:hypothetical protein